MQFNVVVQDFGGVVNEHVLKDLINSGYSKEIEHHLIHRCSAWQFERDYFIAQH